MCQCQIFGTLNTENGALSDVLNVSNVCNMLQYRLKFKMVRTSITKYILLFYSRFLSPHHRYLSLRLFISMFSLISVFSIHLPQHADHQRPPLDAVDLTKDHHSTPPIICLLYSASGSFFFFPFFFFPFTFFSCGLGNGWVWMGRSMVGGFGLWVMAVGGLRW